MPVVLKPQAWPAWLGEQSAEVPQLKALLAPYPSDESKRSLIRTLRGTTAMA
jgi:putative SOS response-associated peptidase YedK